MYIVECADGSYYTGWTTDLEGRVAAHNKGCGSRYTRVRCPVELVYWEEHPDRRSAQRRELALKRLRRPRKTALIAEFRHRGSGDFKIDQ